ncbi:Hypothetical predicted protein, partial [Podarcis lilfordi]
CINKWAIDMMAVIEFPFSLSLQIYITGFRSCMQMRARTKSYLFRKVAKDSGAHVPVGCN